MSWRSNDRPHPEEHIIRTTEMREHGDVHGWVGNGQSPEHETEDSELQSWAERNGHDQ